MGSYVGVISSGVGVAPTRAVPAMKKTLLAALLALAACGQNPAQSAKDRYANAPAPTTMLPRALLMSGPPLCGTPTTGGCTDDAHAVHAAYMKRDTYADPAFYLNGYCNNCHTGMMGGWFDSEFDPSGARRPAFIAPTATNPNPPRPQFNGWSWDVPVSGVYNCSNVACHGVPERTYSWTFQSGDGGVESKTAILAGGSRDTPVWGTTGNTCNACHGAPSDQPWHGRHANGSFPGANECSLCHPNVTGTVATGIALSSTALHGNGVADVQAKFKSACFGCH